MADANSEEDRRRIEAAVARALDLHQKDRESLLANEGFAISMQQVVSAALLLGALSKWDEIVGAFGPVQVLAVVFVSGVGLIAAVLAAQLRHDYRMWNVKGFASQSDEAEANRRYAQANQYLRAMRVAMWISTVAICVAVAAVLAGAWLVAVWTTMPLRQ